MEFVYGGKVLFTHYIACNSDHNNVDSSRAAFFGLAFEYFLIGNEGSPSHNIPDSENGYYKLKIGLSPRRVLSEF